MSSEGTAKKEENEPNSGSTVEKIKPYHAYIKPLIGVFTTLTPIIITGCQTMYKSYKTLPEDQLKILIGTIICFFGGVYPGLFAAIEAAKLGGWTDLQKSLTVLSEEVLAILEASKKDDVKDDDKNGISDVKEIDSKALLVRKANLVLTKMNPHRVNEALSSLYKVWLAVTAVLVIKFARTVAFAGSICTFLRKPTEKHLVPRIQNVVPDGYKKWVPVLNDWITKMISMSVAFYITSIIVAFTSALTGGLMVTRGLLSMCTKKGWQVGGLLPKDHKDTLLDEFTSYFIAFAGFMVQFKMNFNVPFPLNILLFPAEIAEQFIRWSVTKVN